MAWDADAIVVGAGPVGTAAALGLARAGLTVLVLEARATRPPGSRAIGVHPAGLAVLDRWGVADALLDAGTRIRRGVAWGARGPLPTLELGDAEPYPFVLAVPQPVTEAVLAAELGRHAGTVVERGARVDGVAHDADGVALAGTGPAGEPRRWRAPVVLACDGRDGAVRAALGIRRRGGPYPDRFAMADLLESPVGGSPWGPEDAVVVLHSAGVAEGFPLPRGLRRWVVRLPAGQASPPGPRSSWPAWVADVVAARTGHRPALAPDSTASSFGVERWLADRFAQGRVALLGDAAHVLSPIGGQGMNLGWLDADVMVEAIVAARSRRRVAPDALATALAAAGRRRRAAARRAIARAALNTALGRPAAGVPAAARDAVLTWFLRPPMAAAARRRFTMGGLS